MHHKAAPIITSMDLTTLDYIRISIGVTILLYVANCLINQKVWIRKTFSWGAREEYPKIFQMNIIGGSLIGSFLVASPFLFWHIPCGRWWPCPNLLLQKLLPGSLGLRKSQSISSESSLASASNLNRTIQRLTRQNMRSGHLRIYQNTTRSITLQIREGSS